MVQLISSLYDHRTGISYTWDKDHRVIRQSAVAYVNPSPYGETSFMPGPAFQKELAKAYIEATEALKPTLQHPFIPDKSVINGFDGEGFFNGELQFLLIRSDRKGSDGDTNYRVQFRAKDMVESYENGGYTGMVSRIKSDIIAIDGKQ